MTSVRSISSPPSAVTVRRCACRGDRSMASSLELLDRARPILLQQPRQRAIGEQPPFRLTTRAVVRFVVAVANALHRRRAGGAGLPEFSMHRHLVVKGGDLLGKAVADVRTQSCRPLDERLTCSVIETRDLIVGESECQLQ